MKTRKKKPTRLARRLSFVRKLRAASKLELPGALGDLIETLKQSEERALKLKRRYVK